jgi:hypothetical protein
MYLFCACYFDADPYRYPERLYIAPSGVRRIYLDANIGFSFVHPDNWNIDAAGAVPGFALASGYSVAVYNHNNGGNPKDIERSEHELKIEVIVLPDEQRPLAAIDLEQQVRLDATQAGVELISLRHTTVAGNAAIAAVTRSHQIGPQIATFTFRDAAHNTVYIIVAYPANTRYQRELADLVATFGMPKAGER